jgi:hypothetical protein
LFREMRSHQPGQCMPLAKLCAEPPPAGGLRIIEGLGSNDRPRLVRTKDEAGPKRTSRDPSSPPDFNDRDLSSIRSRKT